MEVDIRQHDGVEATDTLSEAWDAASGGLVFLLGVMAMGGVVVLAGWTAARYTSMAIALGCAVASAIVATMSWTAVRWAKQEPAVSRRVASSPNQKGHSLGHAA